MGKLILLILVWIAIFAYLFITADTCGNFC